MDVVATWLVNLQRAWETADPAAASQLFTDEAVYRSHPFREPLIGREAIAAYWESATATQDRVKVRFGRPVVEDNRVGVQWWTTMIDSGEESSDAGMLLLVFEGDRCRQLREYWHLVPGLHEPARGWGE
jgi:hypothetical protein